MTTSEETVSYAIAQPTFDVVRNQLLDFRSRISSELPLDFWQRLSSTKEEYVNKNNQLGAKAAWCLETVGHIQDNFISAVLYIRAKKFRKAWDLLEQCENATTSLDRHFLEHQGEFGIEHVRVHARQLQELYHLKWGFSPGLLFEEVHCSVCQVKRTLRGDCGHEIGEIFNGEICANVVTKAKILHISIVDSPAQKYSVIWPTEEAPSQFIMLKYLADELLSPWDVWRYHKEIRRRHHPAFENVGHSDPCPCGSDLKYRRCCMKKDTVPDFPHFRFTFSGNTRGQFPNLQVFTRPENARTGH